MRQLSKEFTTSYATKVVLVLGLPAAVDLLLLLSRKKRLVLAHCHQGTGAVARRLHVLPPAQALPRMPQALPRIHACTLQYSGDFPRIRRPALSAAHDLQHERAQFELAQFRSRSALEHPSPACWQTLSFPLPATIRRGLRFLSSRRICVQKRQQIRDGFLVKSHTRRIEISPRAWLVDEVSVPVLAAYQRRTIPLGQLLARLRRHVADGEADPSVC